MMPVIRVSDATWERLKAYARPFEDKPEDVVVLALNALDEKVGRKPPRAPNVIHARTVNGSKLPQKEFRIPLMKALLELGGSADVADIRRLVEKKVASLLSDADYEPVAGGDPRWWNATCWERANLVREGLFLPKSQRGVWELSEKGKQQLRQSA
jgi:Mrr N-terminal domain